MSDHDIVHLPPHLHEARGGNGATFLLNARTGCWHVLNQTASALWRELERTGHVGRAIETVAERYPPATAELFRADAREIVADLLGHRLLAGGHAPATPGRKPQVRPAGFLSAAGARPGRRMSLLAYLGVLTTLVLLLLPFHLILAIVGVMTRTWCTRPTNIVEALNTVAAVEAAANRYPGRAACLERSLAAVVTAAFLRRRISWVIGVVENPSRFHAWVEVDGLVVTRSVNADAEFTRVLTL